MPTRREVEAARRALKRLGALAGRDLARLLDLDDRALQLAYSELLAEYGAASAALGVDVAHAQAASLGVRPTVTVAAVAGARRAAGALSWAARQFDPKSSLATLTDELVKEPYRETIRRTAEASLVRWARVPTGAKTCAFCLVLASRGAVYRSEDTAGAKYHGDCDCMPVMSRTDDDLPEGYNPYELYGQYTEARKSAGSGDLKAILAELRKQQGIA